MYKLKLLSVFLQLEVFLKKTKLIKYLYYFTICNKKDSLDLILFIARLMFGTINSILFSLVISNPLQLGGELKGRFFSKTVYFNFLDRENN